MNIILYLLITFLCVHAKYECTNNPTIVTTEPYELTFFGSKINSPNDIILPCDITFVLNSTYLEENFICYAVTRTSTTEGDQTQRYYIYNNTFHAMTVNFDKYLEGMIIFDKWGNHCPMEVISKIKPFMFTDESQVIYLTNSFDGINTTMHPCQWRFASPDGYGFKITIEQFDADADTELVIENRTDILINKRSVKLSSSIYNSDTYIQIYLKNSRNPLHFQAYITVVKNFFVREDGNCTLNFIESTNIYKWGNFGTLYGHNQMCSYNFTVLPNTITYVKCENLDLGDFEDYVGFYDDDGETFVKIKSIYDNILSRIFAPYKNGTPRTIRWEFSSDGSINGFGFGLLFQSYVCECRDKSIPCDSNIGILNIDSTFSGYCGNMTCEFTLEPCQDDFTLLELSVGNHISFNDIVQVYSNGFLIYQIPYTETVHTTANIYLNSTNLNILKVITFQYEYPATKILLTRDNPSYVINTIKNPLTIIEISDEMQPYNYTVEIHRQFQARIFLFKNESLTYPLNEECTYDTPPVLGLTSSFYTCTIKNYQTFVILADITYGSTFQWTALELLNIYDKCVFDKTIFPRDSKGTISTISSPEKPCTITWVFSNTLNTGSFIETAWTSSSKEVVKMYVGSDKTFKLFEYNSKTQNYWNDISCFWPIYTIEVPKNSSLFIKISDFVPPSINPNPDLNRIIIITKFPYYSIVAPPSFGIYHGNYWSKQIQQSYVIGNIPLRFTAIYINYFKNDAVWLSVNSTYFYFSQIGDFYVFRNQIVVFKFSRDPDAGSYNDGALIFIEALPGF